MDQSSLNDFKQFLDQSVRLPVQPPTLLRLLTEDGEQTCVTNLQEAANFDPLVTAVLLKTFTSLTFGDAGLSDSLRGSEPLGPDQISHALLCLRIARRDAGHPFSLSRFRRHSFGCAVVSELLAKRMGYPAFAEAFLAGLLHDLGKIALSEWNRSAYASLLIESRERRVPVLPLEERELGIGHTVAGTLLMQQWNFPTFLQAACNLHHDAFSDPMEDDRVSFLPRIVQYADRLCHLWDFGSCVPLENPQLFELSERTPLSADDFCALFLEANDRVQQFEDGAEDDEATEEAALDALLQRLAKLHVAVSGAKQELEIRGTFPASSLRRVEALALKSRRLDLRGRITEPAGVGLASEQTGATQRPVVETRHPYSAVRVDETCVRDDRMVLVAEDDYALRVLLIEILRRAGFQADGARDGLEAIRKLIDGRYLAAILDLQMPRIDGLEVLVTSRRIAPNMPIVVLTGLIGGAEAATEAGAFRCLQKPASNQEILEALEAAVASRTDTGQQDSEATA
jgi:CheY-like chemotaxis protein/HD-like signal output (HDOD) protein